MAPTSMALTCRVEEPSTASQAAVSVRSEAVLYSITSSARNKVAVSSVIPIALAVF